LLHIAIERSPRLLDNSQGFRVYRLQLRRHILRQLNHRSTVLFNQTDATANGSAQVRTAADGTEGFDPRRQRT